MRALFVGILCMLLKATAVFAQTCAPGITQQGTISEGASAGYETVTPVFCVDYVVPAGRKWVTVKYSISFRDRAFAPGVTTATLQVLLNGITIFDEGSNGVVDPSFFPPGSGRPCGALETCYSKSAMRAVPVAQSAGGVLRVVLGASTDNQAFTDTLAVSVGGTNGFNFFLQQTDETFVPRDASDSGCATAPANCWPRFRARIDQGPELTDPSFALKARMRFRLTNVSSETGSSTNYGQNAATELDYWIDPALQQPVVVINPKFIVEGTAGVSVRTREEVATEQVVITSRDYGGRARLAAFLLVGDEELNADIERRDAPGQVVLPPTCSSPGSTLFASLPVDEDCNRIADSWERPLAHAANLPGGVLPGPQWDAEDGPGPAGRDGDGIPAFDEYRGFHVLEQAGGAVIHKRLNPVSRQDVFLWDSSSSGLFSSAVAAILRPQTSGFIDYHFVDGILGRANAPSNPGGGTDKINVNSPYQTFSKYAQALAEVQEPGFMCLPSNPPEQQVLATATSLGMNGDGVKFYTDRIAACAAYHGGVRPFSSLLASIVAHEIGHRLTLIHHYRYASFVSDVPTPRPVSAIRRNEWAFEAGTPLSNVFFRLEIYRPPPSNAAAPSDSIDRLTFALQGYAPLSLSPISLVNPVPATASTIPVRYTVSSATPPPPTLIRIYEQRSLLMDWSIRWDASLAPFAANTFSPSAPNDLALMCVKCLQ